ncbi:VirB4 family type IV secretion system protein [Ethanoligenens sp.]|uniref:VirB4 family type IV secretion system protein n=1 Tax=Ethanoligenens sp. TaxID=2099655 RepID=UPI0039EC3054
MDLQQTLRSNLRDKLHLFMPGTDNQSSDQTEEDIQFIKQILPSGITQSENYLKSGNCYMTVFLVNKFPTRIQDLAFTSLFNAPGVTVTMDLEVAQKSQAMEELESSINELDTRVFVNRHSSDNRNDSYDLNDLLALHKDLQLTSEDIAYISLRFWVYAKTIKDLDAKVNHLRDNLKTYGMYGFVPSFEILAEYRGMQTTANTIRQPIPILGTLKQQFPYYFQSFTDPHGWVWGETKTGGLVLLDTSRRTSQRKSSDIVFIGQKGAGKSTELKYHAQIRLALGDKVLAYDVEGEMLEFAVVNGGRVVQPADPTGYVNFLELHQMFSKKIEEESSKTVTIAADETSVIAENYTYEMSRLLKNFQQLFSELEDEHFDELRDMLMRTFLKFHITKTTPLISLAHEDFPVIHDLYDTIFDALYETGTDGRMNYKASVSEHRRNVLERLLAKIKPYQRDGIYAPYFDHHSAFDIANEQLVVFDMSSLNGLEENISNAYIMHTMSLMWSEVYKNRIRNMRRRNEDIHECILIFDEAHKVLNTKNTEGLALCDDMTRRDRKYDAAIWLASQQPRDFAPSGYKENLDKIRNIFGLIQYKVLMQQDQSNFPILKELFPQFTDSEIESTALYEKGEKLISIGAGAKIRCTLTLPDDYLAYFGGGR